ncbi:TPA: baseplate tail-tube junction protein [Candidatus Woesearchaeota archaeon]|nr:baseplate tail-tube junction protein [Candidatus Woesearchaeota archaeon]
MARRGQSKLARTHQIAGLAASGGATRNVRGRKSDLFQALKEDMNNGQNQFQDGTLYQYPSDLGGVETSHFVLFHIYSGHSQQMESVLRGKRVIEEMLDNSTDYNWNNTYENVVDPTTGEILMTADEAEGAVTLLDKMMADEEQRMAIINQLQAGGGAYNANNPQEIGRSDDTSFWAYPISWTGEAIANLFWDEEHPPTDTANLNINMFGENVGQSASHLTAKSRKLLRGSRGPTRTLKKETRVSKAQYRAKETVALYMPHKINDMNSLQYEMKSLSGGKMMKDAFLDADVSGLGKIIKRKFAQAADAVASAIGAETDNEDFINAYTKLVGNPRSELPFSQPQQRKFTFNFEFAPRTEEESEAIFDIIKTLKTHAYPATASNGTFYHFPSEFQIEYYKCEVDPTTGETTNVRENDWLNRIGRCALTEISVDYAPTGTYQTFENGAPTHINVMLSFGELELLTQQHILEGY